MIDKKRFAELMQFFAIGIKGQELTKIELQAYWYVLEDEFKDIAEFEKAVKKLMKKWNYSYMPKPAHFIEAKFKDRAEVESIAVMAWKSVIEAVEKGVGYNKIGEFEDNLIPAVVETISSFKELSSKGDKELEFIKSAFIKSYVGAYFGEKRLMKKEQVITLDEPLKITIKAPYEVDEAIANIKLEDKSKKEDIKIKLPKIKKF